MSHSPGPWKARDGQVWGPNPHEDGEVLICDTAPDGAALTEYDADNAHAIAALPDMLKALDECIAEHLKHEVELGMHGPVHRAINLVAKVRAGA